jgi:hypothetical protein
MIDLRRFYLVSILALAATTVSMPALPAVSPQEAAALKTTLTPLGGERAGNSDGSIPAWTGVYDKVPPGYVSGNARPDPFPEEKPLYSIDPKNVDQYAPALTDGILALFKKHPDYRIDVYPTHRTAGAPQWVYDNTFANATRATLTNEDLTLHGAYGGTPFPIPKSGVEVVWNHLLRWTGESVDYTFTGYIVDSNGTPALDNQTHALSQYPYYYKDGSLESFSGIYWYNYVQTLAPPYKNGEFILFIDYTDFATKPRQAWQYLSGQRRVRRAPTVGFDVPNTIASGFNNFDEVFGFMGSPERYDWKLLGKKEMIVPYNDNKLLLVPHKQRIGHSFIKPEYVRWEKHRVWVVDATLKHGARHTLPHKRFYFDEDGWCLLLEDEWDGQNVLWRHYQNYPIVVAELPGIILDPWGIYNIENGDYNADTAWDQTPGAAYKIVPRKPETYFTPEALASRGVR